MLGAECLTGALLDQLTHHIHILEMSGDSFRLKHKKHKRCSQTGLYISATPLAAKYLTDGGRWSGGLH